MTCVHIEQILQSAAFPHIYCFCYHKNYLRIYKTCFQNHSTVFLSLLLTSAIHPWNPFCTSTSSGSLLSGSIPPKYSLLCKSNPMYVPGEVPGNLKKKRFMKDIIDTKIHYNISQQFGLHIKYSYRYANFPFTN